MQTSKNYETCNDICKLSHINQAVQTATWKETCIEFKKYSECRLEQTFTKFIEIFVPQKKFLYGKKSVVETILVAIAGSSSVCCFDLYLINMLTKSTKAERCTDITFRSTLNSLSVTVENLHLQWGCRYEDAIILGTHSFVLLDANLGTRQAHDTSVRLIFLALHARYIFWRNYCWKCRFTNRCSKCFQFDLIER